MFVLYIPSGNRICFFLVVTVTLFLNVGYSRDSVSRSGQNSLLGSGVVSMVSTCFHWEKGSNKQYTSQKSYSFLLQKELFFWILGNDMSLTNKWWKKTRWKCHSPPAGWAVPPERWSFMSECLVVMGAACGLRFSLPLQKNMLGIYPKHKILKVKCVCLLVVFMFGLKSVL